MICEQENCKHFRDCPPTVRNYCAACGHRYYTPAVKMDRKPGFYFVKLRGEWTVAKYCLSGVFLVPGGSLGVGAGFFETIDERRIERK